MRQMLLSARCEVPLGRLDVRPGSCDVRPGSVSAAQKRDISLLADCPSVLGCGAGLVCGCNAVQYCRSQASLACCIAALKPAWLTAAQQAKMSMQCSFLGALTCAGTCAAEAL